MASEHRNEPPYSPTYRQADVDGTLDDHEERISANERSILIIKGAVAGIGLATGGALGDKGLDLLIGLLL